jgi:hypothetical protein
MSLPYEEAWYQAGGEAAPAIRARALSERVYAGTIGLLVLLGLGVTGAVAEVAGRTAFAWVWPVPGAVLLWAGIEAAMRTQRARPSFLGLLLADVGIGLILAPVLLLPEIAWARGIAFLYWTGLLLMTGAAWIHPGTVRRFGTFLVTSVLAFLLHRHALHLLPGVAPPDWLSLLCATLILGYIDYYWTRALQSERTLNNAIDAAASLYVEAASLLLHRLEERSRRRGRG